MNSITHTIHTSKSAIAKLVINTISSQFFWKLYLKLGIHCEYYIKVRNTWKWRSWFLLLITSWIWNCNNCQTIANNSNDWICQVPRTFKWFPKYSDIVRVLIHYWTVVRQKYDLCMYQMIKVIFFSAKYRNRYTLLSTKVAIM